MGKVELIVGDLSDHEFYTRLVNAGMSNSHLAYGTGDFVYVGDMNSSDLVLFQKSATKDGKNVWITYEDYSDVEPKCYLHLLKGDLETCIELQKREIEHFDTIVTVTR